MNKSYLLLSILLVPALMEAGRLRYWWYSHKWSFAHPVKSLNYSDSRFVDTLRTMRILPPYRKITDYRRLDAGKSPFLTLRKRKDYVAWKDESDREDAYRMEALKKQLEAEGKMPEQETVTSSQNGGILTTVKDIPCYIVRKAWDHRLKTMSVIGAMGAAWYFIDEIEKWAEKNKDLISH